MPVGSFVNKNDVNFIKAHLDAWLPFLHIIFDGRSADGTLVLRTYAIKNRRSSYRGQGP